MKTQEITDRVRCNNCMLVQDESITECKECKTDKYLMQPYCANQKDILREIKALEQFMEVCAYGNQELRELDRLKEMLEVSNEYR